MTAVMRSPMRGAIRRRPRGPSQSVWGEDDAMYRGPNIATNGGLFVAVLAVGRIGQAAAAIQAGHKYEVSFATTALSLGGVRLDLAGTPGLSLLAVGTQRQTFTASATGILTLQSVGTFTGTIDAVVVWEIFS